MKKIYIAMAVFAAAALVSCEREQSFNEFPPVGDNEIVFTINSGVSTKSVEEVVEIERGVSIPLGSDNEGNFFSLDETIVDLNFGSPVTKGTPAYTENVGTLYTTMGVYADGNFGEASYTKMDDSMYDNPNGGQGWRYNHVYSLSADSLWPDEDTPVDFYFNMPADPTSVEIKSRADKEITFDYESPLTGADQEDILFGQTSISKSDHDGYLPKGAPVMMYHALTGVKFASGHANDNPTKTIITQVKIKGLKSTGSCTFSDNSFEWEGLDNSTSFTQTFENTAWSANSGVDNTVTYTSGENNKFGDSWYSAGNTFNLNDDDGSLTFWFIPQEIDENVTLEVTFRVKTKDTPNGTEITHTIKFGEQLNKDRENNVEWKAGQLRTYTLKPRDVDVKIVDSMVGLKKSDLHVTNTGNVDEFVRIMVIGNWYGWETQADKDNGKEPDIMVGYTTDGSDGTNVMVDPWFREDEVYGQYFDDTFPMGRPAAGRTDWVRGTGSYFYYTQKIGAGVTLDSATQSLFQSYELPANKIPVIYIPVTTSNVRVPAVGVHLKMEIVVQAIGTTDPDGNEYVDQGDRKAWMLAWSDAVGKEITIKN